MPSMAPKAPPASGFRWSGCWPASMRSGVERKIALDVVMSVALDSTPPVRRSIYRYLCQPLNPLNPPPPNAAALATRSTKEVAEAMGLPTSTVRRGLEELTSYGLADHHPQKQGVPVCGRGSCCRRRGKRFISH